MKIDAMLTREDFYGILVRTVKAYYRTVRKVDAKFGYERMPECERLLVNGKLGFVSRRALPQGLKKYLHDEYNVRGGSAKRLAAKAAVKLIEAIPTIGKCSDAYLTAGLLGKNEFILPQNRSVRFFDYDAMSVDCMVKDGFTDTYFRRQLAFRTQHDYDFIPKLLAHGDNWFREGILVGHALARTTDGVRYQKGIKDALQYIGKLIDDTASAVDAKVYAERLAVSIAQMLARAEKEKHIKSAVALAQCCRDACRTLAAYDGGVPLAMSHGDLQSGNIWLDEAGKTWIYDWETAGVRSVWYDCAVLNYSLRRACGWQALLGDMDATKLFVFDSKAAKDPARIKAAKSTVFLEDVCFYLEDLLELPEDWGTEIFDAFGTRMTELLNGTEHDYNK